MRRAVQYHWRFPSRHLNIEIAWSNIPIHKGVYRTFILRKVLATGGDTLRSRLDYVLPSLPPLLANRAPISVIDHDAPTVRRCYNPSSRTEAVCVGAASRRGTLGQGFSPSLVSGWSYVPSGPPRPLFFLRPPFLAFSSASTFVLASASLILLCCSGQGLYT